MGNKTELDRFQKEGRINHKKVPADSCVIEGTKVLLYDGTEKTIESINPFLPKKEGDKLMSVEGTPTYPVAVVAKPNDTFPVIDLIIETEEHDEYSVTVSISHAFFRSFNKFVNALYLKEGDKVITKTGEGIIISHKTTEYTGKVWNVYLASEKYIHMYTEIPMPFQESVRQCSLLGLKVREQTIITNGIVSGSLMIQKRMSEFISAGIDINQIA